MPSLQESFYLEPHVPGPDTGPGRANSRILQGREGRAREEPPSSGCLPTGSPDWGLTLPLASG